MWPPSRSRKSVSPWRTDDRPTISPATSATRNVPGTQLGGRPTPLCCSARISRYLSHGIPDSRPGAEREPVRGHRFVAGPERRLVTGPERPQVKYRIRAARGGRVGGHLITVAPDIGPD